MHRADIVLIGPLDPLLPRTIRVRLVVVVAIAMMVFCLGLLAVAVLSVQQSWRPSSTFPWLAGVLPVSESRHNTRGRDVSLQVGSRPAGAAILSRNRELGHTPATVTAAQQDLLVLRRDGFLDAFVRARGPSVEVPLWHVQPDTRALRPPFPGAVIKSAAFLPDGRVSLAVEVPPNSERQAWAFDPAAARMDRLGRTDVPGTIPSTVAIAPDAVHTATIVRLDGLDGTAADQLTLDGPSGPRQLLTAPSMGERLLDASWSPRSDFVLLLSSSHVTGGTRFHLSLVSVEAQARDIADLPGEPMAGSWVWARDGSSVAFLVHTGTSTAALVALDLVSSELRYLDDLRADNLPSDGAVAPASWTASGELLYAAPASGGTSAGSSASVLFRVAPRRIDAHRVGDVEPVWAPFVRDDGIVLTLARGENEVLVLRPVDQDGRALAEQRLGVQVAGAFVAHWDLRRSQLLILQGASAGGVDVLLLRFGTDDLSVVDNEAGAPEPAP
jgi:hypothetical protein